MPSIVSEPYIVAHIRRITTTELDPDTGDPVIVDAEPIIRRAQNLAQLGHSGSSHQIFDAEHLKRIDSEIRLSVADPSIYAQQDQVRLFPSVDDQGQYVPETGTAFFVDGLPNDGRLSPWPQLTKMFGGVLALRRVT
jgi:hypothetical protein